MSTGQPGGAGVITQRDLDASIALRRRAKDAMDEWKAHHRDLARKDTAGVPIEPGRYRVQRQTIEGGIVFSVWDGDSPSPYPGCTAAFTREELTGASVNPTHAKAFSDPQA